MHFTTATGKAFCTRSAAGRRLSDSSNCIAEHFVRDSNGGCIAFVGNSRYGIYQGGSSFCSTLSNRYNREFFEAIFEEGHYILGKAFSDHKNESPVDDDHQKCIFDELNLLGDPGLLIWTENPSSLSVTHAETLPVGSFTDFVVEVSSSGSPVEQATVCLWKDGDLYEIEESDPNGVATFWFYPSTEGTMYVTVSKHNYIPYLDETEVVNGTGPYILTDDIAGQGQILFNPPGGSYAPDTVVTCTADPDDYWCFDHWEADLSGSTNPDTVVMTRNRVVRAVFEPDCNQNGTADGVDITNCSPGDPDCDDCNENGIPDSCDIANCLPGDPNCNDCNNNDRPDSCDLLPSEYVDAQDDCIAAETVCPNVTYYGSTSGATNDGSASCGDSNSTADVWYYYDTTGYGSATISLCDSSYNTVLSVHSGCPGTSSNELGCNDDWCGSQSRLSVSVQSQWHILDQNFGK